MWMGIKNKMKKTMISLSFILAFLILMPLSITWADTWAEKFSTNVIAVEKGNVIKVLYRGKTLEITLYGIDCPEISQSFGQKARQFTSRTVLNKSVIIEIQKQQSDTQYMGNVILPDGTILNQNIVRKGLAAWDPKNAPDDIKLESLQLIAKDMGVGMWARNIASRTDIASDITLAKKNTSNDKKVTTPTWKTLWKTLVSSPLLIIGIKISILIIIFIALVFLALKYTNYRKKKIVQKPASIPPTKSDPTSPMMTIVEESETDFEQAQEAIESNRHAIQGLLDDLSGFVFTLVENNSTYDTEMTHHKTTIKNAMTRAGVEETKRLLLLEIDQIQTNSHNYRVQLDQANNTINQQKKIMTEIQHDAKLDFLTKLTNRRAFDKILKKEFERTKRYGGTFSLAMLDIDFFKKVNDKYGHITGDKTLQLISKLLREQTRVNDSVGRFGGEEFIILLPQTPMDKAHILMEKIRQKVQDSTIIRDGNKIKVTISIGVGEIDMPSETMGNFIKRIDAALYQAKKSGRNLVIVDQSRNSLNS
jgi:diguanylate cyclase (GGDEF)-like protein